LKVGSYKLPLFEILVFLFIISSWSLANGQTSIEDKNLSFTISAFSCNSFSERGYIQVREFSFLGTPLDLNKDLGIKSWGRPGICINADIKKKNLFLFSYCESVFKGSKYLKKETWYNGTLLVANSKADIKNTTFKSFEWVWMARVHKKGNHNLYIRTAVLYERLKFYVDAEIAEDSPIKETFEKFWKQQQPLPTFGLAEIYHLNDKLSLEGDISFTYLPKVKTWMNEGGVISLKQSNLDAKCILSYTCKNLCIESGFWFKHLKLLEESKEDTNDFLINSAGFKVGIGYCF